MAELYGLITEVEAPEKPRLCPVSVADGQAGALMSLLNMSKSRNTQDRVFAARKLREINTEASFERLNVMVNDPQPQVRRIARYAIEHRKTIKQQKQPQPHPN